MTAEEVVRCVAGALDSKKAIDVRAIGIRSLSVLADYFVIASGTSNTHVRALADEVEFTLSEKGIRPKRIEGGSTENWMLLDYGAVIVHVFQDKAREFYDLERLWQDGTPFSLEDVLHPD